MSKRIPVLYFSRGRGHGHAIQDVSICKLLTEFDVRLASYGTGADTIRRFGLEVADMGLGDRNFFLESFFAAHRAISEYRPAMVIANEEFAAIPAAALAGVSALFMADWLPPPVSIAMEALRYADSIVVWNDMGIFPVPVGLKVTPLFMGRWCRRARKYSDGERAAIKSKMGLSKDEVVVLVIPGGGQPETNEVGVMLICEAFRRLPLKRKRMIWLSKDVVVGKGVDGEDKAIRVDGFVENLGEYLAVADLVITKGNRFAIMDAAAHGVRCVSISFGNNPPDDMLNMRIPGSSVFNVGALDPESFAEKIMEGLRSGRMPEAIWGGEDTAGKAISDECFRLIQMKG